MSKRKPKPPKPLIQFRAYPQPGSLYVMVRIFRTLKDMRRHAQLGPSKVPLGKYYGCMTSYHLIAITGKKEKLRPEMGEILLAKDHLGAGIVSHECTHAMFAYFQRKRITVHDRLVSPLHGLNIPQDHPEEIACHTVSNLVRRIYQVAYDRRVIE